jgi:hypothetical protein
MREMKEMGPLEDWILMATDEDDWEAENLLVFRKGLMRVLHIICS